MNRIDLAGRVAVVTGAARGIGYAIAERLLQSGAAWWVGQCSLLLVEGVGGLLCPLTEDETVADLAVEFGLPMLIVARATLGTINHTLLTIEAARRRGLRLAGVLLNEVTPAASDASIATNAEEIERSSGVRVLGVIPHRPEADLPVLERLARIDWNALARA